MNLGKLASGTSVVLALLGACLAPPDEGVDKTLDAGVADGASDAVSCPSGYDDAFGRSRYRVPPVAVNAIEAEELCAADGTHLVVIDEEDENAHVRSLEVGRLWLGLVDAENVGGMTADWTWVTGETLGPAVWDAEGDGSPEPDGSGGCVVIDPDAEVDAGWDDTGCVGNTTPLAVCECDGATAVLSIPE